MLGHAAEYLVNTRSTSISQAEAATDRQAVRILMRLSREVFEEYAAITQHHHPVADWVMDRAVRIYGAA
jgi:23S rRNA maturation-related 3'-5' exoribonuclease YhaM